MPTVTQSTSALPAPTHARASTYASALAQDLLISFADGIVAKKIWDGAVDLLTITYNETDNIQTQLDLLGAKQNSLEFVRGDPYDSAEFNQYLQGWILITLIEIAGICKGGPLGRHRIQ